MRRDYLMEKGMKSVMYMQYGTHHPPNFFPLLDYMKISLYKTIRSS